MLANHKFHLRRAKMLVFLDELNNTTVPIRSLYLPAGQTTLLIDNSMLNTLPQDIAAEFSELAAKSANGAILFWGETKNYLITPPFPITESLSSDTLVLAPLISQLKHDFRVTLILVRAGSYAIGLCQGETLIGSKVGTGNIHSRQRQGGRSAKRFEHRRDKQVEYFLTRVCEHAREIISPYLKTIDYIVYGGSREIIQECQNQCPLFQQFNNRKLPPFLDIHDPNQAVLEDTIMRLWSSTIIEWRDN